MGKSAACKPILVVYMFNMIYAMSNSINHLKSFEIFDTVERQRDYPYLIY
jgi:hypothetical protein